MEHEMITPIELTPSANPSMTKFVRVPSSARKQIVFKLTDADGKAVDLNSEVPNPPAGAPDLGGLPPATGAYVTVKLRTRDSEQLCPNTINLTGTLLSEKGFVEFELLPPFTDYSGVYAADVGRFAGDNLVDTWPVFIHIEPNAFQAINNGGPLSIPEIRLALLDLGSLGNSPFSNLLDDMEFSDVEIVYAMRRVVDIWNETPPPVLQLSTMNFPYRHWWTVGTTAQLLRMAAARYRRNRLDYNAGGVAINDQSKADEYEKIAEMQMAEFKDWMMREKYRINMELCWSTGL
jgi:hypothetical protein